MNLSFNSRFINNSPPRGPLGQAGQIVVEYVLLLVVLMALAGIIVQATVSRTPGSEGFIISNWMRIVQAISIDLPDTVDGEE
ncbi:MAG: hypothetical protein R2827_07210 [Bdellovibrionales bacterium]